MGVLFLCFQLTTPAIIQKRILIPDSEEPVEMNDAHTHAHTYTHARIHTYIHTHTRTHTHTNTHRRVRMGISVYVCIGLCIVFQTVSTRLCIFIHDSLMTGISDFLRDK